MKSTKTRKKSFPPPRFGQRRMKGARKSKRLESNTLLIYFLIAMTVIVYANIIVQSPKLLDQQVLAKRSMREQFGLASSFTFSSISSFDRYHNDVDLHNIVREEETKETRLEKIQFEYQYNHPVQKLIRDRFFPKILNDTDNAVGDNVDGDHDDYIIREKLMDIPKPPDTFGAFIHIGKTGGSTLCKVLRNCCHSFVRKPCPNKNHTWFNDITANHGKGNENLISKSTTYYHTPDFENGKLFNFDKLKPYRFLVFTVRDPLSRAMSSFLYDHPRNKAVEGLHIMKATKPRDYDRMVRNMKRKVNYDEDRAVQYIFEYKRDIVSQQVKDLYIPCFPTMEAYAQWLGGNHSDSSNEKYGSKDAWKIYKDGHDCAKLAMATLHHSGYPMTHNYWDLRQVIGKLRLNGANLENEINTGDNSTKSHLLYSRPLLVVRTEQIWKDWTSAHRWLGEEEDYGPISTLNYSLRNSTSSGVDYPIKKVISEEGRKYFCLALKDEYRLYLRLLVLAKNLDESEVQESFKLAKSNCPELNLSLPLKHVPLVFIDDKDGREWKI